MPHERQRATREDLNVFREGEIGQVHVAGAGASVALVNGFVPRIGREVVDLPPEMQNGVSQRVILGRDDRRAQR